MADNGRSGARSPVFEGLLDTLGLQRGRHGNRDQRERSGQHDGHESDEPYHWDPNGAGKPASGNRSASVPGDAHHSPVNPVGTM